MTVDSRVGLSDAEESRDTVVASVRTLEDEEVVASIELRVDAMLCLEVLRLSMLRGRNGLLKVGLNVEADATDLVLVELEDHSRPRNREAAEVTSEVRAEL